MLPSESLPQTTSGLTNRTDLKYFRRLVKGNSQDTMIGLVDYTYSPIALGDSFTTLIKMAIQAHRHGAKFLRLYINFDGGGYVFHQLHVTENNYRIHLANILPAFRFSPIPMSLHLCSHPSDAHAIYFAAKLKKQITWPAHKEHVVRRPDYYSHFDINTFFKEYGFIPKLAPPPVQIERAQKFYNKFFDGKFLVTVNIRQRASMDNYAALYRDSSVDSWYRFFDIVAEKYPNVIFLNVGGFAEWERSLGRKRNVVISRVEGMGLADEITLLLRSNLYMGSSSGFSAAATFSSVPYVITHVDPNFAPYFAISVGSNHPFATQLQTLSWVPETTESLLSLFEEKFRALR